MRVEYSRGLHKTTCSIQVVLLSIERYIPFNELTTHPIPHSPKFSRMESRMMLLMIPVFSPVSVFGMVVDSIGGMECS